jgi:hypothetical protein
MADLRKCACGRTLPEPGPGGGRRRKWCEVCRPPESKVARSEPEPAEIAPMVVQMGRERSGADREPVEGQLIPESVYAATLGQLVAASREHTAAGMAALALARQLDANVVTAPSVSNAMLKALDVALAGAKPATDALDELRQRRERKASGA